MKKLILTAACVGATISCFAQGTVIFQNAIGSAIYYNNSSSTSNKVSSGTLTPTSVNPTPGSLDVGLVWGTSAAQLSTIQGGTLAGIEQISTAAGVLNGAIVFPLPGTTALNSYFINVLSWDSSYGDTLAGAAEAEAAGAWFGSVAAGPGNTVYGALGTALSLPTGASTGPGTPIMEGLASMASASFFRTRRSLQRLLWAAWVPRHCCCSAAANKLSRDARSEPRLEVAPRA